MADKFINAPVGATHYAEDPSGTRFYKLHGTTWNHWVPTIQMWQLCSGNKPQLTPVPLRPQRCPLGATHEVQYGQWVKFYRFDGSVWKFWNTARNEWMRCADNKPEDTPRLLPPSEQAQCCGTTCDKRNVADYIARLEDVANAARALPVGEASEALRLALAEVYGG